jgi:hypothetical protein
VGPRKPAKEKGQDAAGALPSRPDSNEQADCTKRNQLKPEIDMNATTMTNGRGRKSLASQLDRLDQILDCLSDGLNEAVATAVKEAVAVAVEQAVRTALCEVLTNADVLALVRGAAEQSQTSQPTSKPVGVRVRERIGKVMAWIGHRLRQFGRMCCVAKNRVQTGVATFRRRLEMLRPFRTPILIALSVGMVAGVAAYFAGPWLSAVASGIGGFATTLAVQVGLWLRRMLGTSFSDV